MNYVANYGYRSVSSVLSCCYMRSSYHEKPAPQLVFHTKNMKYFGGIIHIYVYMIEHAYFRQSLLLFS